MLSKAIYYADLRELAAYTQQAYQELKDIDISNDVHRKMRNLDIYKGVEAIKSTIDYLGENELPDEFAATEWAANYMRKNTEKVAKFWNEVQSVIMNIYQINNIS